MSEDIIPILSTVIMVAIGMTIVLAVGSYLAFRLRDLRKRRKDREAKKKQEVGPRYLERYYPQD